MRQLLSLKNKLTLWGVRSRGWNSPIYIHKGKSRLPSSSFRFFPHPSQFSTDKQFHSQLGCRPICLLWGFWAPFSRYPLFIHLQPPGESGVFSTMPVNLTLKNLLLFSEDFRRIAGSSKLSLLFPSAIPEAAGGSSGW